MSVREGAETVASGTRHRRRQMRISERRRKQRLAHETSTVGRGEIGENLPPRERERKKERERERETRPHDEYYGGGVRCGPRRRYQNASLGIRRYGSYGRSRKPSAVSLDHILNSGFPHLPAFRSRKTTKSFLKIVPIYYSPFLGSMICQLSGDGWSSHPSGLV